mmetsp:Transcript_84382/g.239777  ORF Transcript_84382/g.239777 Transcript_84382/m.239777 type:complete len:228 (-) Transcript_84382:737-1420(-)
MMSPNHIKHPYPTEQEKKEIMVATGIELKQLTNWFLNNRKRFWKPLVDAMHAEPMMKPRMDGRKSMPDEDTEGGGEGKGHSGALSDYRGNPHPASSMHLEYAAGAYRYGGMPPYNPDMMYHDARGSMYGGMPPPRMPHEIPGPGHGVPPPPHSMGIGMGGMDHMDGMARMRGDGRRSEGARIDSSAVPSEGSSEGRPQGPPAGMGSTSLEMQLRCRRARVHSSAGFL